MLYERQSEEKNQGKELRFLNVKLAKLHLTRKSYRLILVCFVPQFACGA